MAENSIIKRGLFYAMLVVVTLYMKYHQGNLECCGMPAQYDG